MNPVGNLLLSQLVNPVLYLLVNLLVNQLVNQLSNHLGNLLVNLLVNQLVNQLVNPLENLLVNQQVSQPASQLPNQLAHQVASQRVSLQLFRRAHLLALLVNPQTHLPVTHLSVQCFEEFLPSLRAGQLSGRPPSRPSAPLSSPARFLQCLLLFL